MKKLIMVFMFLFCSLAYSKTTEIIEDKDITSLNIYSQNQIPSIKSFSFVSSKNEPKEFYINLNNIKTNSKIIINADISIIFYDKDGNEIVDFSDNIKESNIEIINNQLNLSFPTDSIASDLLEYLEKSYNLQVYIEKDNKVIINTLFNLGNSKEKVKEFKKIVSS